MLSTPNAPNRTSTLSDNLRTCVGWRLCPFPARNSKKLLPKKGSRNTWKKGSTGSTLIFRRLTSLLASYQARIRGRAAKVNTTQNARWRKVCVVETLRRWSSNVRLRNALQKVGKLKNRGMENSLNIGVALRTTTAIAPLRQLLGHVDASCVRTQTLRNYKCRHWRWDWRIPPFNLVETTLTNSVTMRTALVVRTTAQCAIWVILWLFLALFSDRWNLTNIDISGCFGILPFHAGCG